MGPRWKQVLCSKYDVSRDSYYMNVASHLSIIQDYGKVSCQLRRFFARVSHSKLERGTKYYFRRYLGWGWPLAVQVPDLFHCAQNYGAMV